MARKPNPLPKYEKGKGGTARVRWVGADGKRREASLGRYGSAESKAAYQRVVSQILAGREAPAPPPRPVGTPESVAEIAAAFAGRALAGYSKSERGYYSAVLRDLAAVDLSAAEFGPKALSELRDGFVARGWTREHVNAQVRRVRAVFRWAESLELVPPGKWFQLRSLPGLKRGTGLPEQRVVKPVSDEVIEATLPHLSPTVAAMVRFHRLTGCRPQDVCNLHTDHLDRSADVWVFRPEQHKGTHRGHTREVYIGPRAQQVILPFLDGGFVFSPRRAWQEKSDARRAAAKRLKPGWVDRGPPLTVRDHYTTHAYGLAVERACLRAGVEHWQPNQLRHARGTEIRATEGLEAAQRLLGHKHARTTERYAAIRDAAAVEAARKTG